MRYREIQPSGHVRGLIKCYWTLRDEDDTSRHLEPIVPDGSPEMVFNLNAPFQRLCQDKLELQPRSIVVGQMKSVVTILPTGRIDLFGIRFWPYGLHPILQDNVAQITGTIESAATIFGQRGSLLEERINSATGDLERIDIFEDVFRRELARSIPASKETAGALRIILRDPSGARIEAIAKILGVSIKQLERRFKREVGLTPKFFARVLRFQQLLAGFEESTGSSWTEICYDNGFSDQSHMIREFRSITGASPMAFIGQKRPITDLFIS